MMSSFLSADRYVQDPSSAQSFNRYVYCRFNPLRYVDPTGWKIGAPKSKTALIQDYQSDPCYITRQQLREAGMYDIEGGYGWAGGSGTMSACWIEGDGSFHSTEWGIQIAGGGFEAGAWAIPSSFNPMWVNECQGYCNWGDQSFEYGNSILITNGTLTTGSCKGGGRLGLVKMQINQSNYSQIRDNRDNITPPILRKTIKTNYYISSESTLIGKGAELADIMADGSKEAGLLLGKIARGAKCVGIVGVGINLGCIYLQIDNNSISNKEGSVRMAMTGAEFGLTFIPYVGPILSIGLTAYDLGGGFDNNLYNTEKWWPDNKQ